MSDPQDEIGPDGPPPGAVPRVNAVSEGDRLPALRPKVRDWSLDDPIDPQAAYEVVEGIAFGRTLRELEREPHLPPLNLFIIWVMKNPQLALAFNKAREISGFVLEDEILDLLRLGFKTPESALKAKLLQMLTDGMWKIAAKRNPAVFGDKATVNVTVPVSISTSLDLGKGGAAVQREQEITNIYSLKAEVEQEVPEELTLEVEQRDPATGKRRGKPKVLELSKRTATRTLKRILVPKRRAAETAVEREAREKAERILQERKKARSKAQQRYREKQRREGGDGDDAQD